MNAVCVSCGSEYDRGIRRGKPGKITVCEACADEDTDVQPYTGVVIYGHKAGATLQINADPKLTQYLIAATRLKNKGSNLGENLKVSAHMKTKTEGACIQTADQVDYKGRNY